MAGVSHTAANNNSSAAVCPDTPPTGTQPCKFRKNVRLGVFFDGTGNNMYDDRGGNHITNVVRLLDIYDDKSDTEFDRDKLYLIGVGAGGAPTVKQARRGPRWPATWWC